MNINKIVLGTSIFTLGVSMANAAWKPIDHRIDPQTQTYSDYIEDLNIINDNTKYNFLTQDAIDKSVDDLTAEVEANEKLIDDVKKFSIQGRAKLSDYAKPNGVASLNSDGKVPNDQLPTAADSVEVFKGNTFAKKDFSISSSDDVEVVLSKGKNPTPKQFIINTDSSYYYTLNGIRHYHLSIYYDEDDAVTFKLTGAKYLLSVSASSASMSNGNALTVYVTSNSGNAIKIDRNNGVDADTNVELNFTAIMNA